MTYVGLRIYQLLKTDPYHHQNDKDKTKEGEDDEGKDAVEGHAVGRVILKSPTRHHHPTSHPGPFQKVGRWNE